MKVIGINGSARKNGNTSIIIKSIFMELEKKGIETELIELADKTVKGCIGCFGCKGRKQCVIKDDFLMIVLIKWLMQMELYLGRQYIQQI